MQKLGLVLLVIGLLTMAALLFSWGWDWYKEIGFDRAKELLTSWLQRLKCLCPYRRSGACSLPGVNRLHEPSISLRQGENSVPLANLKDFSPLFQVDEGSKWQIVSEEKSIEVAPDRSAPSEVVLPEKIVTGEVVTSVQAPDSSEEEQESPLLILHVVPHQDELIYGPLLLRSILQLGLRHGARSIFHRHRDPSGNGPVLFSLVNMVLPGTFSISSMGEFTTQGVSFFMTIPSYGDTMQNFKLMLQAAHRLADDIGGVVLDDQRRILTLQKSDHYKARIRHLLASKTEGS